MFIISYFLFLEQGKVTGYAMPSSDDPNFSHSRSTCVLIYLSKTHSMYFVREESLANVEQQKIVSTHGPNFEPTEEEPLEINVHIIKNNTSIHITYIHNTLTLSLSLSSNKYTKHVDYNSKPNNIQQGNEGIYI